MLKKQYVIVVCVLESTESTLKTSNCRYKQFSSNLIKSWGAYHLTEKSGWGVESIMVSDLPVYRRNATSVTV